MIDIYIKVYEKSLPRLAIFNAVEADINTKGSVIIKVSAALCFIFVESQDPSEDVLELDGQQPGQGGDSDDSDGIEDDPDDGDDDGGGDGVDDEVDKIESHVSEPDIREDSSQVESSQVTPDIISLLTVLI